MLVADMAAKTEPVPRSFDAVILGAGVSGLSTAYFLVKSGLSVCILDAYPEPGGNHISKTFNGFSFDIGSIFFWSDNPQFKMFPGTVEAFAPVDLTFKRVTPSGAIQPYPIDLTSEVLRQPGVLIRSVLGVVRSRLAPRSEIKNAEAYANFYLGPYLYDHSGLKNYVERFYGIPANQISLQFIESRMPLANKMKLKTLAGQFFESLKKKVKRPDSSDVITLGRPIDGFEGYYREICRQLEGQGVEIELGVEVSGLIKADDEFRVVTSNGEMVARRIINTLPIKKIFEIVDPSVPVDLSSSRMCTLCCSFAGDRGFDSVVLYNFQNQGQWKRLTMHSDYYGRVEGREYFSLEIIGYTEAVSVEAYFEEFKQHCAELGLFKGDLKLEGHMTLDFAYPVCNIEAEETRVRLLGVLKASGIESAGRQGNFDYIPHSTLAIEATRERFGGDIAWAPYRGPTG